MYWPWPEEDLLIWGQKIKGQGHIWTFKFSLAKEDPNWYCGQEVKAKLGKFEFVAVGVFVLLGQV